MKMDALDDRITAAFLEGAKSEEVAPLIAEAEAAAVSAGETAERARDRALDPVLSAKDVAAARREMEDAAFRRDRMQRAIAKLTERLNALRGAEEDARRWIGYERARAERDKLATELKELYPPVAAKLSDLMARIEANDKVIHLINTRAKPNGASDILGAEALARRLNKYIDGTGNVPRITEHLKLPAFEYDRHQRYTWPRS